MALMASVPAVLDASSKHGLAFLGQSQPGKRLDDQVTKKQVPACQMGTYASPWHPRWGTASRDHDPSLAVTVRDT